MDEDIRDHAQATLFANPLSSGDGFLLDRADAEPGEPRDLGGSPRR
jgi:hypothetical protein